MLDLKTVCVKILFAPLGQMNDSVQYGLTANVGSAAKTH